MQDVKAICAIFAGALGSAAVVLAVGATILAPRPVLATPAIAQKTGEACTQCHTTPPTLNAYGKKYQEDEKKK